MTERILVTGGGGYLGSILVPKLLGAGNAVTVVDTFTHGDAGLAVCCAATLHIPSQWTAFRVRDQ